MRWLVGVLLTLAAALSPCGSVYNTSSVEEIQPVADDVVPPGVMLCNKGRSGLRVLVGISLCFSDTEITVILLELDTGPQDKFTFSYDLYINVAKNSGRSFTASKAKNKFTIDWTIGVRICTGAQCPAATVPASLNVMVPTISRFCDAHDAIVTTMHCSDLTGTYPFTSTSDQRKLQCSCTCPGGKVATTNGVCVCPSGSRLDGGVCVTECLWGGGGACGGSLCSW